MVLVFRAFNKQKTECERFENSNEDYAMTAMTAGRITSILMPAISVIFGVTTAAVLGVGSYYVELGAMEVGSLVANPDFSIQSLRAERICPVVSASEWRSLVQL